MILYNNIYIYIYMISFISLSLSLSRCSQIASIIIVGSLSSSMLVLVGWVIIVHSLTLPPSSSSFSRQHLLDLNCCDGCHDWGGSSMLVLLGFILGFDGNNFCGIVAREDSQCQCGLLLGQRGIWFLFIGAMVGLVVR